MRWRISLIVIFSFCSLLVCEEINDSGAFEKAARKHLANKLLKLSQNLNMKEASFRESLANGKAINANDGNAFSSDTTYHSYVWSYCLNWIGNQFCQKWIDPYVSLHGFAGESSPLERKVAALWSSMRNNISKNEYTIWHVERSGGGEGQLGIYGDFDTNSLTDWRLLPGVAKEVQKIGTDTADKTILSTFDSKEKGNSIMPNLESLRLMASRWTKMFRNRMVANLGELRAMDVPVEFALGEDIPECEDYLKEVKIRQEVTKLQERIQPQPTLNPVTQAMSLDDRYKMCKALRNASVYMINPQFDGKSVTQGDVNGEQIDKWRSRLNIAAIDYAGIDVRKLPRPANTKLKLEDLSNELRYYKSGGLKYKTVRRTPAEQIRSYNEQLEIAAEATKDAARRSEWIIDNSKEIKKWKIKPGTKSAVLINYLTPEMKAELDQTGYPGLYKNAKNDPTRNPEMTPTELTQKSR